MVQHQIRGQDEENGFHTISVDDNGFLVTETLEDRFIEDSFYECTCGEEFVDNEEAKSHLTHIRDETHESVKRVGV
jgi:hypothetical protein